MPDKQNKGHLFDSNAEAYDQYRPSYPTALIKDLIQISELNQKEKQEVLEIGCGSGQLTVDLVNSNLKVTGIELGNSLAKLASDKIKHAKDSKIINTKFEDWESDQRFKLVVSAQAFHWIEKKTGIDKVVNLLSKKATFALIWNIDESQNTPFWKKSSVLYDQFLPQSKSLKHTSKSTIDYFLTRPEFGPVIKMNYPWEKTFSEEEYLGLLSTFSGHIALEENKRRAFFGALRKLISECGGQVLKKYNTIMYIRKKKN